jgi:ribosome-binding factor A
VSVSKDLAYAKVRVSGFKERNELESAVTALNHASGFIQGRLGRKLKFRETPKLTFLSDHSIEEGFEVNRTIDRSVGQPSS